MLLPVCRHDCSRSLEYGIPYLNDKLGGRWLAQEARECFFKGVWQWGVLLALSIFLSLTFFASRSRHAMLSACCLYNVFVVEQIG